MGPEVASDSRQVVSGSSQSCIYLQCAYKYSLMGAVIKKKKRLGIVPVSVLEKECVRNSTLVFDDCFLPLTYLRFERTVGNLVVVTFPESMLLFFFLSLKQRRGCGGVEKW